MRSKVFVSVLIGAAVLTGGAADLAGGESDLLRADDERVDPPEKITHVNPVYPEDALKEGIQGSVEVELIIGESGDVEGVEVTRSDPHFDEATIEAVRQWKYRPATLEGKPVRVLLSVTVNFRLE